jgi:signal transduction histidine kinase
MSDTGKLRNVSKILRSKYLRNILILSIIVAITLPVGNILFIYPSFLKMLINNTEEEAKRVAKHSMGEIFAAKTELSRYYITNHLNGIPDTITADERKLKQIMYNLLSNAVKFTPDGGKISIKAQTCDLDNTPISTVDSNHNRGIKISVSDTGIGLNPRDLDRIFNPFEQVETTAGGKLQGTGLGLSLTKNLVKLHGGSIWAESEGEGKGSTFHIVIPT